MINRVYRKIKGMIDNGKKLHITLIDPADQSPTAAGKIASQVERAGSDIIFLGGSTGVGPLIDKCAKAIKSSCGLPVLLFPGNIDGITATADALLFMSLLNSRNPYWIIEAQALSAPVIKKLGIETISMGYIIVQPGATVGWVGDAKAIPRHKPELAVAYSLAAEMLGMKMIYLEAGSGVEQHVPPAIVSEVKKHIHIPLIVGGGIRTPESARLIAEAGADAIVTGSIVEESNNIYTRLKPIVSAIHDSA